MISVPEILKKARKKKNLSLQDLSERTKIRQKHLEALEKGEWEELPGLPYIKGFLKSYAESVDLDSIQVLALFRREYKKKTKEKLLPKGLSYPLNDSGSLRLTIKKILYRIFSI